MSEPTLSDIEIGQCFFAPDSDQIPQSIRNHMLQKVGPTLVKRENETTAYWPPEWPVAW